MLAFCTVLAANYIASARTLAHSLREAHPEAEVYALFVDDATAVLNVRGEPFAVVRLEELGIKDLPQFCFKYDVVELATAVKPRFFSHLFDRYGVHKLVFLDPDILVLGSIAGIVRRLDLGNIVLTPQIDADIPGDGYKPDPTLPLRYGLFNLGFLGLKESRETRRFLDWWWGHLRENCVRDGTTLYYVDQKFGDLVPCLFDGVQIEKGHGYNVAYWNIHSRWVRREGDIWMSDQEPLCFFHFSGFDPGRPGSVSRDMTRPVSPRNHDIFVLLAKYAACLFANGYEETRRVPYGHSRFADGQEIDYRTRFYYRRRGLHVTLAENPFVAKLLARRNRFERMRRRYPWFGWLAKWANGPLQ